MKWIVKLFEGTSGVLLPKLLGTGMLAVAMMLVTMSAITTDSGNFGETAFRDQQPRGESASAARVSAAWSGFGAVWVAAPAATGCAVLAQQPSYLLAYRLRALGLRNQAAFSRRGGLVRSPPWQIVLQMSTMDQPRPAFHEWETNGRTTARPCSWWTTAGHSNLSRNHGKARMSRPGGKPVKPW